VRLRVSFQRSGDIQETRREFRLRDSLSSCLSIATGPSAPWSCCSRTRNRSRCREHSAWAESARSSLRFHASLGPQPDFPSPSLQLTLRTWRPSPGKFLNKPGPGSFAPPHPSVLARKRQGFSPQPLWMLRNPRAHGLRNYLELNPMNADDKKLWLELIRAAQSALPGDREPVAVPPELLLCVDLELSALQSLCGFRAAAQTAPLGTPPPFSFQVRPISSPAP
jgi:hypothetical protein